MCLSKKEEKKMATAELSKVGVKDSLMKSLKEVEEIRNGKLPKRSYKEMMQRVRENLKENK